MPRAAVFESARRLARWHYQWIVTHEFLPAIVGQTMSDSVYKEVLDRRPEDHHQVLQADEPRGAPLHPGRVRGGRIPLRPQHHPTPLHRPGRLRQRRQAPGPVSSVPLFQDAPSDNNLNGHRELPPRLKIQWSKFFNAAGQEARPPGPCASSTLRWPTRCSRCPRRRCPTPTLWVCSRSGTSAGAGRWACPRDSRWLG